MQTNAPSSITATEKSSGGSGMRASAPRRSATVGDGRRPVRVGDAVEHPGVDPADVGVEHLDPGAAGERGHRRRGVVADARQRTQRGDVERHLPTVRRTDRGRRRVQSQRAPGIAEPAPRPHRVAGRRGSEGGRRRPSTHPLRPHRKHPRDRRLLQHELADKDAPRVAARAAPRQRPGGAGVPIGHVPGEVVGHRAAMLTRPFHPRAQQPPRP